MRLVPLGIGTKVIYINPDWVAFLTETTRPADWEYGKIVPEETSVDIHLKSGGSITIRNARIEDVAMLLEGSDEKE